MLILTNINLPPNNTDKEADKMRDHLSKVSPKWSNYTAGMDGLVNKMIVQLMMSGSYLSRSCTK